MPTTEITELKVIVEMISFNIIKIYLYFELQTYTFCTYIYNYNRKQR